MSISIRAMRGDDRAELPEAGRDTPDWALAIHIAVGLAVVPIGTRIAGFIGVVLLLLCYAVIVSIVTITRVAFDLSRREWQSQGPANS